MFSLHEKLSISLIPLILISFSLVSILGMGLSMETRDGQMSPCPFMAGQATLCQMSVTEHIAQWRKASLGIPTRTDLLALATALLALAVIPFIKSFSKLQELTKFAVRLFARQKAHIVKVFDPLLLAFSDGILNPKIYGLATL